MTEGEGISLKSLACAPGPCAERIPNRATVDHFVSNKFRSTDLPI
jgi:hypothetical protein